MMRRTPCYCRVSGARVEKKKRVDAPTTEIWKLLPKLHGSQARLGPVLKKLKELASKTEMKKEGEEQKAVQVPLYKLTHEKLDRMQERLKANGFTSFAEA